MPWISYTLIEYLLIIEGKKEPIIRFILKHNKKKGTWTLKETSIVLSSNGGKPSNVERRRFDINNPDSIFNNIGEVRTDIFLETL